MMGLTLGTIVFAGFNQNAWKEWKSEPVLGSFLELGALVLAAAVIGLLVLTENPLILYPLALVSSAGVLVVLGLVYTVVALLVLRRENRIQSWSGLALPVGLGLGLALLQIGLLDLARLAITGTWGGFSL
jgi:hypothetical protein